MFNRVAEARAAAARAGRMRAGRVRSDRIPSPDGSTASGSVADLVRMPTTALVSFCLLIVGQKPGMLIFCCGYPVSATSIGKEMCCPDLN